MASGGWRWGWRAGDVVKGEEGGLFMMTIDPSLTVSINQSIHQSLYQSISQTIHQSVHQSINQFINNFINQSVNQSIGQSISQSANPPVSGTFNQQTEVSYKATWQHFTKGFRFTLLSTHLAAPEACGAGGEGLAD